MWFIFIVFALTRSVYLLQNPFLKWYMSSKKYDIYSQLFLYKNTVRMKNINYNK